MPEVDARDLLDQAQQYDEDIVRQSFDEFSKKHEIESLRELYFLLSNDAEILQPIHNRIYLMKQMRRAEELAMEKNAIARRYHTSEGEQTNDPEIFQILGLIDTLAYAESQELRRRSQEGIQQSGLDQAEAKEEEIPVFGTEEKDGDYARQASREALLTEIRSRFHEKKGREYVGKDAMEAQSLEKRMQDLQNVTLEDEKTISSEGSSITTDLSAIYGSPILSDSQFRDLYELAMQQERGEEKSENTLDTSQQSIENTPAAGMNPAGVGSRFAATSVASGDPAFGGTPVNPFLHNPVTTMDDPSDTNASQLNVSPDVMPAPIAPTSISAANEMRNQMNNFDQEGEMGSLLSNEESLYRSAEVGTLNYPPAKKQKFRKREISHGMYVDEVVTNELNDEDIKNTEERIRNILNGKRISPEDYNDRFQGVPDNIIRQRLANLTYFYPARINIVEDSHNGPFGSDPINMNATRTILQNNVYNLSGASPLIPRTSHSMRVRRSETGALYKQLILLRTYQYKAAIKELERNTERERNAERRQKQRKK